jgi:DNA-binding response OmpR family regulator
MGFALECYHLLKELTMTKQFAMNNATSHILYVEDHADTRELVTLTLKSLNYRVATSSSIEDALSMARANHFDLFILDSWLPDGAGIELCRKLREFDQDTPILFFSAAAYESDKHAALDSGAQAYLTKPADLALLGTEVSRLIEGYRKTRLSNGPRPVVQALGIV